VIWAGSGSADRLHTTADGPEDQSLPRAVGEADVAQRDSGGAQDCHREPNEGAELRDSPAEGGELAPQVLDGVIQSVDRHDLSGRLSEPPSRGRPRHAKVKGELDVARGVDELAQPGVVDPLCAGRSLHAAS